MFAELLERVATALDAAGIPYTVVGGQAVLIPGEARLTKDVDVTLAAGAERLGDVVLRKNPELDRGYVSEWLKRFEDVVGRPLASEFAAIAGAGSCGS